MRPSAYTLKIGRENLPDLISSGGDAHFESAELSTLADQHLPPQQVIVGHWVKDNLRDPFPDFIAINDDEFDDALAWAAAFLSGVSPITQWCRLLRLSDFRRLAAINENPSLNERLGAWVGLILAETSINSAGASLKETPGAVALTTSSFGVARALSVWGQYQDFDELLSRHDALMGVQAARNSQMMLAIWYVIAGASWDFKAPADARSLEPLKRLVIEATANPALAQSDIVRLARSFGDLVGLMEVERCATGPQSQRVEALDALAHKLMVGPRSVSTDAIMGLGASLVDPGAAVLPELLKQYTSFMPSALLWAGAFAGVWFPVRVMSDHGGLGRLVAKELMSPNDLFAKPRADISFEELARWTGGNFGSSIAARGLFARTLLVELLPGITVPMAYQRDRPRASDASSRPGAAGATRQPSFELGNDRSPNATRSSPEDTRSSDKDVSSRLQALESGYKELAEELQRLNRSSSSRPKRR